MKADPCEYFPPLVTKKTFLCFVLFNVAPKMSDNGGKDLESDSTVRL